LNGELVSAQLNQAYNTLKKKDSRQAYDEKLLLKPAIHTNIRQAANDPGFQENFRSTGEKPSLSLGDALYRVPVIGRYPKFAVWGLLAVVFSVLIFASRPDNQKLQPVMKVASRPAIEIREQALLSASSQISELEREEEKLADGYLEQSIHSSHLSRMLDKPVVNKGPAISQPGANKQPVQSTDVIQQEEVRLSRQKPIPGVLEDKKNDSAAGFDGGPPGSSTDVNKLLTRSIYMDEASSGSSYSVPPEMVMMQFIQGYEAGDIEGFSRLFVINVRTNHGWGRQQLVNQFSALFDATTSRRIQIRELKVEPQSQSEALLISDIEAAVQHENEVSTRYYNGEIVFRLITGNSGMQIAEMLHSVH